MAGSTEQASLRHDKHCPKRNRQPDGSGQFALGVLEASVVDDHMPSFLELILGSLRHPLGRQPTPD
jgi:hypothetical protein